MEMKMNRFGGFPKFEYKTERIIENSLFIKGGHLNIEHFWVSSVFDANAYMSGKYKDQTEYFMKTLGVPQIPYDIKYESRPDGHLLNFKTCHGPPYRMFEKMSSLYPNLHFYTKSTGFIDSVYVNGNQFSNIDTSHVIQGDFETTFLTHPIGESPILMRGFNRY